MFKVMFINVHRNYVRFCCRVAFIKNYFKKQELNISNYSILIIEPLLRTWLLGKTSVNGPNIRKKKKGKFKILTFLARG